MQLLRRELPVLLLRGELPVRVLLLRLRLGQVAHLGVGATPPRPTV